MITGWPVQGASSGWVRRGTSHRTTAPTNAAMITPRKTWCEASYSADRTKARRRPRRVQGRGVSASPLQLQPGKVAMSVLRSPVRALLLPLTAGCTLLFHSVADARRVAQSTVVVGRVSTGGVPVATNNIVI